ncbi:TetR/AcrR family transcriptional regulator [Fontivita pretiosa]|uniref:TetR/AcrR family transcriptional regulator n=1 Tax=Fontivita pretiosa TaxID=2989684 RepID=UPI003D16DD8C
MSRTQSKADSSVVQDRLLDAAEQVVARDGVANLTLDAVAREAGVSKGGLLYHYPSKSALITAIVERLAQRCETDQQQALANEPPAPGAFTRAFIRAHSDPIDPRDVPVHSALLAAAGTNPQFMQPFRKRFAQWQARLEADGIDPAIAMIVRLAIDGLCLGPLLGIPVPQGELRERVVQKLIAMTCQQGHEPSEQRMEDEVHRTTEKRTE